MDRRGALRLTALALLGGCLSGTPADTGPRNPPHETTQPTTAGDAAAVNVESFDAAAADDGRLRVAGSVRNDSGRSVERTVVVTATVEGKTYQAETAVTVPAGGTAEFAVTLDVEYAAFTANGNLRVGVQK